MILLTIGYLVLGTDFPLKITCSFLRNVPKLADARKGNKDRSFRFAQTASMYLSSSASLSGSAQ